MNPAVPGAGVSGNRLEPSVQLPIAFQLRQAGLVPPGSDFPYKVTTPEVGQKQLPASVSNSRRALGARQESLTSRSK